MNCERSGNSPEVTAFVPATLPPTSAAVEPARPIGFARGILLFWAIPHRLGPHLAAGSLPRAVLANVLAMIIIASVLFLGAVLNRSRGTTDGQTLRESAAEMVLRGAAASAQSSWIPSWSTAGVPLVAYFAFVLLALFWAPWIAAGDRPRSVWMRAVKSTLWAVWTLIPISLVLAAYVAFWMKPVFTDVDWATVFKAAVGFASPQPEDWSGEKAVIAAIVLVGAIWFLNCIRAAARYVGPDVGPGFGPREPRCERCGYVIVGLPLDGQCPECLEPVRDSVPGGRRVETDWECERRRPRGVIALVKTHAKVIRSAEYFRTLRVRQDLRAARHFWWTTFALLEAPVIALIVTIGIGWEYESPGWEFYRALAAAVAFPLVLQCLIMLAACAWGWWRYGIDDLRMTSAVALYSSPLLWFSILVVPASLVIADEIQSSGSTINPFGLGIVVELQLLVAVGFYLVGAIWLIVYWLRICRGLRLVRYANS